MTINRIDQKFKDLKKRKKKALIIYMTAGSPSLAKNAQLACSFEKAGVDFIELGVPFSDPLADGVVIQAASERSLQKGTNLKKILNTVRQIRKKSQVPILLMSYLNPIFRFGLEAFTKKAFRAGVDGLIIPDLPPEEGAEVSRVSQKNRLDLVYLLAPTSHAARRRKVCKASKGFVYYVSLTGVTGARRKLPSTLGQQIALAKRSTKLPICVGFGISTPQQAKAVSRISDGIIIGSAIVKQLMRYPNMKAGAFTDRFVRPFARALGKGN